MKSLRVGLLASVIVFGLQALPASAANLEDSYRAIATSSGTAHILPRYRALAEKGEALAERTAGYCAAADESGYEAVDAAFRDYWLAWADIRHIQFGPVEFLDRAFRIQFWPDKRNRTGKQLSRMIAAADDAALAPERFSKTSVALQGLPALERLLADGHPGLSGTENSYSCKLATAIAQNLSGISSDLAANWNPEDGYTFHLTDIDSGIGPYEEAYEVPADLIQSMIAELEASRDLRLGRAMGSAQDRARPKLAEAWRSGLSLPILARSVAAIGELYLRGGFDAALREHDETELADRIRTGFEACGAEIAKVEPPLFAALSSPAQRARLETIRTQIHALEKLIGTELAAALEISPGFNSRDGD